MDEIKGLIYDLDGTVIKTTKLHELAWLYAGKKFGIYISDKMLLNQRGIPNEAAAEFILPYDKKDLTKKFVAAKVEYVMENVKQITLFPGILRVIAQLLQNDYKVWICTSAHKYFVSEVLNNFNELDIMIKNHCVWRKMYGEGKPSPKALNVTLRKMGLTNLLTCYIGNAFSDYQTSINAKVKFIYFCPNLAERDLRIPKLIPIISSHEEIWRRL